MWARPVRYFAQQTLNKGPGLHVAANCDVAAGKATNEHELWWTLRNRAGPNDGPELVLGASVGTACVSAYFGPSGSYFLGLLHQVPDGFISRDLPLATSPGAMFVVAGHQPKLDVEAMDGESQY